MKKVLKHLTKNKTTYLILSLILLLASFLRFYRLPEMAQFDYDQEYASNFAYNVIKVYPIQLIGQNLSVQGLFMGPLYFYYLVPFYFMANLHPIGGAIGSVIFGLLTILTYYFVGSRMFGVKVGLIAAFLRTVLFTELEHDWAMAPAYAADLITLLTWYLFYKYWNGQVKVLPLITFLFGLYASIHPVLFPFYGVFLALILLKRKIPNYKILILSTVSFIAPLSSLILFEFLHNFLEVKRLFELFGGSGSDAPKSFDYITHLKFIASEPSRILGLGVLPDSLVYIPLLLMVMLFVHKKIGFFKERFHSVMFVVAFVVFFLYYLILPTHVTEYYFIAITTLITLYLSVLMAQITVNRMFWPIVVLLLINIFYQNFKLLNDRWSKHTLVTLAHKDKIVKEIVSRQSQGSDFFVSYIKLPGWNFGFDYLFKLYNRVPQTVEARPPVYSIVIPADLVKDGRDITSGGVGLILPKEN